MEDVTLYVDDVFLTNNDLDFLYDTKDFLTQNCKMKDMGEISYVIGIKIHRDRSKKTLGLSQKAYIEKILEKFRMKDCAQAPIVKREKFNQSQYLQNNLEWEEMKSILYAFAIGSLMYIKSTLDLAFICSGYTWQISK